MQVADFDVHYGYTCIRFSAGRAVCITIRQVLLLPSPPNQASLVMITLHKSLYLHRNVRCGRVVICTKSTLAGLSLAVILLFVTNPAVSRELSRDSTTAGHSTETRNAVVNYQDAQMHNDSDPGYESADYPGLQEAVEQPAAEQIGPTSRNEFRYGVGFQGSFPAWGLSGMMTLNETISVQAILGLLGTLNTVAGRGLYTFREEQHWDAYGYGMVGYWSYRTSGISSDNALGFGAGAGIQYDWRAFDENLPPIYWNIELGFGVVNLDNYNFSTIMFGTGVHYRF